MSEPALLTLDVLAAIDALQIDYLRALDQRDMNAWLDCFDAEASYVCISRENVDLGLSLALMMDDCHARLKDRVSYVTQVWAGSYEDYNTKHFVQRLACLPKACEGGPARYAVTSNFMVLYTTSRGRSEVLAAGNYEDEVILRGGCAKFRSRSAVLDTTVVPRYIVYPL